MLRTLHPFGISPDDNTMWRAMGRLGEDYASSLARIVADEFLSLYGAPFRVYVAGSTGLRVP